MQKEAKLEVLQKLPKNFELAITQQARRQFKNATARLEILECLITGFSTYDEIAKKRCVKESNVRSILGRTYEDLLSTDEGAKLTYLLDRIKYGDVAVVPFGQKNKESELSEKEYTLELTDLGKQIFSELECRIIEAMIAGCTSTESLANEIYYAKGTVRNILHSLYKVFLPNKRGDRVALLVTFIEKGLVTTRNISKDRHKQ